MTAAAAIDARLGSPAARDLAARLAADLADLAELSKREPAAADQLVGALVNHLRSWRPESVSPLGTLPSPTDRIRDPRSGGGR